MDFEILLEGTMIGAELNALSEAEIVISRDIKSGDEFADAVIKGFLDQLNEMSKVRKAIQEGIKENINIVSRNKDKIIEILQNENSYSSVSVSSGSLSAFFGSRSGVIGRFVATFRKAIATIDVEKEIKNAIERDISILEQTIDATKRGLSPAEAYTEMMRSLRAMYALGTALDRAIARARAAFNPTANGSPIRRWRRELVDAFAAANRAEHEFEITRVTTRARDVIADALDRSRRTIDEMVRTVNRSGARPIFDAYNAFAINWNKEVVNSSLGKAIGLKRLPYMNISKGNIVIPTPKEAEAARKQAESALTKVKTKIGSLIEKLRSQINDPSIATVAVSVVVAIASYLVFYGAVKAAGGKVGSPAAISTTFKAAAEVMKTATFGKKLLILALFGIVTAAFVAAGTTGFKFIKNKLTK